MDEAFRLTNKDAAVELSDGQRVYPEARMEAFLEGRITLGDLEGITKEEQYQMAEIGHGYLGQRKLEEAKIVFEGLLALDPYDAYFNMALGSVAQQDERPEDAERLYSRALEINPFSASALANRGELRVMRGDLQRGVQDLVKAVELDPKNREPATERARATLLVLREQLAELDEDELRRRASSRADAPDPSSSKPVAPAGGPRARPAPRSRAGGRSAPRSPRTERAGPRRPGPRRK